MENNYIINELIEFTKELIELIKQDWVKTKKFIKEHKKYFFWILTLFVSLQFTDIFSIGKSVNRYYKSNGNHMSGGDDGDDSDSKAGAAAAREEGAAETNGKRGEEAGKVGAASDKDATTDNTDKEAAAAGKTGASGASGASRMSRGTSGTGASHSSISPKQAASKPHKKVQTQSRFGRMRSGMAGNMRRNPVLGNIDKIFNMTHSMFGIILFILMIVGVISLPVIIFIIITYSIIKNILSRLAIL